MPLTPAEVHNVAFKKPPIGKRGYDEEEVDAFLDIVEVELARLIEENNDLKSRMASGQPLPPAEGADPAELAAAREENGRLQNRIGELEQTLSSGADGAQQQVVSLQQQLAQTEQQLEENRSQLQQAQQQLADAQRAAREAAERSTSTSGEAGASVTSDHHQQAVQMLALAQQTADQHLAQSKAEAERLLTEARANAERTITEANDHHSRTISEAEARAKQLHEESTARANQTIQDAEQRVATLTAQFEQRKAALERRVEELRTFEREYRTRLKSYLESQLRDLDASGRAEPASPNTDYAEAQQS
jgi:DivIVA domain-containing protein